MIRSPCICDMGLIFYGRDGMGGLRSSWNLWDIFSNGFQSDLGSILQGAEPGFYGFNYKKVMIWDESVIYDNNVLNDR